MRNLKKGIVTLVMLLCLAMVSPVTTIQIFNVETVQAAAKMNKTKGTLVKGQSLQLKVNGNSKKVKWSSSRKGVATVTSKGKVTAKNAGTAVITAKAGKKKYTCKITVEAPRLSKTSISLTVGNKYNLKVTGTRQKVKWSSSNKKVATVTSKGVVTGKKAGTVKITAKVGSKKYICTVSVKNKKKATLKVSSTNINVRDKANVKVTYKDSGTISYEIADPSIVSCEWDSDWDGYDTKLYITGLKIGRTTVTVTCNTSNEKYIINVNVVSVPEIGPQELAMAAYGIDAAYNAAKFPSTLIVNQIQYQKNFVNGYGDTIKRMVVRCYTKNGFGGYGYIYAVVICNDKKTDSNAYLYDGSYYTTYVYSKSPGMSGNIMNNKTAMDAYHKIIKNSKNIQYD